MLDFQYSDIWTAPKQKTMPNDWKNISFDELRPKVYDYTLEAVKAVKPRYVQIGNEITAGMLWIGARSSIPLIPLTAKRI